MYENTNPLYTAQVAYQREQLRQSIAVRRANARLRRETRRRKALDLAA